MVLIIEILLYSLLDMVHRGTHYSTWFTEVLTTRHGSQRYSLLDMVHRGTHYSTWFTEVPTT